MNKKGFSLVQAMVAMGIMAAASVGIMKVSTQTAKVTKRAEVSQDLLTMLTKINMLVSDGAACSSTLKSGGSPLVTDGKTIEIRDKLGAIAFAAGQKYYNDLEIRDIELQLGSFGAVGAAGLRSGTGNIEITYVKTSELLQQKETTYKKKIEGIEIVLIGNTNQLESCKSDIDNVVADAINKICEELGGVIDPSSKRCTAKQVYDDQYVDVAGDNVTGRITMNPGAPFVANDTLTANGGLLASTAQVSGELIADGLINAKSGIRIASGKKLCGATGTSCIDLDAAPCADTHYQIGFKPSGAPNCKLLPSSQCGVGQYIVSITDGNIACGTIPEAAQGSCPDNEILMGYLPNGDKDCREVGSVVDKGCDNEGEVLQGFNDDGEPICVRKPTGLAVYTNALGALTTAKTDYETTKCSKCGGGCVTKPEGSGWQQISHRCKRGGQCGFRKWRNCSTGFRRDNTTTMLGFLIPPAQEYCGLPVQGNWTVKEVGGCDCSASDIVPIPKDFKKLSGLVQVRVACVNNQCGGGCDPSTKPTAYPRACLCDYDNAAR